MVYNTFEQLFFMGVRRKKSSLSARPDTIAPVLGSTIAKTVSSLGNLFEIEYEHFILVNTCKCNKTESKCLMNNNENN